MSLAEIPFRVTRSFRTRVESWLAAAASAAPPADLSLMGRPWVHASPAIAAAPYVSAADEIAAGRLDVFALRRFEIGDPPRWNRDPKTGTDAPLKFGMLLDYRDASLVGDIKYLWEVNRHSHLVTLAQAFALTGENRYAQTLQRHLESWFTACPYGMGPNWSSALEAAVRLMNWSAAWHLLGGCDAPLFATQEGARFRARWLASVYLHAHFIRAHLSLHSSANNHLIGEAAGLYVAARTWPCWPVTRRWREHAETILEREVMLQNGPDGVNREQAVSYQQFELDLLLVALLAARADGADFSRAVRERMELMLAYLAALMDARGNVPQFGDSDDGYVVRLSQEPGFCRFRSLLATGAALFGLPDLVAARTPMDDKTRWLLGGAAARAIGATRLPRRSPARRSFAEGGYYILGHALGTADEIKLVADAGPLGYGALAAHGHADALSFTLSVGGHEIFIDPGTYTYRSDTEWRAYFRGTSAHNTVRVDGRDQSQQGGNFMWLHKAGASCTEWRSTAATDVFEGTHDGYRRLEDPVVHRRRIVLDRKSRRATIDDVLGMAGTHDVELHFHCAPGCRVERRPDGFAIRAGARTVVLQLPRMQGAIVREYRGCMEPILGWTSPQFDVLCPSTTILWRARLTGATTLRTVLCC